MATLYYTDANSSDLEDLLNWFEDSGFTTPASVLPTETDDVELTGNISQGDLEAASCSHDGLGTIFGGSITCPNMTLDADIEGGSFDCLTGQMTLQGDSVSGGAFTAGANGTITIAADISGAPTFTAGAGGTISLSGSVDGTPEFTGSVVLSGVTDWAGAPVFNDSVIVQGGTARGEYFGAVQLESGAIIDTSSGSAGTITLHGDVTIKTGCQLAVQVGEIGGNLVVEIGGILGSSENGNTLVVQGSASLAGTIKPVTVTFNGPVVFDAAVQFDELPNTVICAFNDEVQIANGLPARVYEECFTGTAADSGYRGFIRYSTTNTLYSASSLGVAAPKDVRAGVENLGQVGTLAASGGLYSGL